MITMMINEIKVEEAVRRQVAKRRPRAQRGSTARRAITAPMNWAPEKKDIIVLRVRVRV